MMEAKSMEYEDLRELSAQHYNRIQDLEALQGNLTF